MTTQWSLTAPTMVLSTQGFSGTDIPQGTPETFVYVNSTLEILSTFVHVFIQRSLESFPCVCVRARTRMCGGLCSHCGQCGGYWSVMRGRTGKTWRSATLPVCGEGRKGALTAQEQSQRRLCRGCSPADPARGASHQQGAAPGSVIVRPTLGPPGPPESKSAC